MRWHRWGQGAVLVAALATLAGLAAPTASAAAADDKKGAGELRRLQQKLRAAEREQADLAQGKAQLDTQVRTQADQLAQVKRGADAATRQKQALEKSLAGAGAETAALKEKLAAAEQLAADTAAKLAERDDSLRSTEQARARLEAALAAREQALGQCGVKNASLHRMGASALTLYQQCAAGGGVGKLDVLTRLKQVGAENMVDEYRDKLDLELVQPLPDQRVAQRKQADLALAEQGRLTRAQVEASQREQEQLDKKRAKEQTDLDRLTRKVRGWLESVEW